MTRNCPKHIITVDELRRALCNERRGGRRVGLVPTMGALHEGHFSLVRASKAECDCTVVSIYVNPSQFGPQEDFEKYPRPLPADLRSLGACGAEIAFTPESTEVYRPGHATWVEVGGAAEPLEGQYRPGHFRGVATIVLKLFEMVQPDIAYFGQKDFQQALVIRRMTADLNVPVEIRVCPIVREPDGLARSSRNVYLDASARERALSLYRSLKLAQELVTGGERDAARIVARMRQVIDAAKPTAIDYIELADPETLEPVTEIIGPTAALLAVRFGNTRLIDNTIVESR